MTAAFRDEYAFLSNFSPSEVGMPLTGSFITGLVMLPTVEHAYQASKAGTWLAFVLVCKKIGVDPDAFKEMTPGQAKRIGREIPMSPERLELWNKKGRIEVMTFLLRQKFAPGSELAHKLLATGDERLIEDNYWHDNFWGRCTCKTCSRLGTKWHNRLGEILMQVRSEIRIDRAARRHRTAKAHEDGHQDIAF